MADFDVYAPFLSSWEGGYVNKKSDPGGATYRGVTIATWTTYCKKHGMTASVQTLKRMTDAQWKEIMKGMYWDKLRCDEVKWQNVANMVADWAVNAGVGTAAKALQRLAGVTADGIVGKQTIAAVNAVKASDVLFLELKNARKEYYKGLARKNARYKEFLNGWLKRTDGINGTYMVLNDLRHTTISYR